MPTAVALFIAAVSISAVSCRPAVTTAWTVPIPPGPCTYSASTCSWTAARGGNSSQSPVLVGVYAATLSSSAIGFPLSPESSSTTAPIPWQGSTPFSRLYVSTVVAAGGNIVGPTTLAGGRVALQAYAADSERDFQPTWTSRPIGVPNDPVLLVGIFPIGSRPDIVVAVATAQVQYGVYDNFFVVVHAVTGDILGFTTHQWPGTFTWLDADEDIIVGWVGIFTPYTVGLTIDANYSVNVRCNVTTSSVHAGPPTAAYLSSAHGAFVVAWWPSNGLAAYDATTGARLWSSQTPFGTVTFFRSLGWIVSTNPNNHLVAMDIRTSNNTWMLQSPNMQVSSICSGETSQGPYVAVATPGAAVWVVNASTGVALGDIVTPSALVCWTSSDSRLAHIVVVLSNSLQHLVAHF